MIKEIPILFSTPMVQAILDGRKTETRREVKDAIVPYATEIYSHNHNGVFGVYEGTEMLGHRLLQRIKCRYGKPGDVLWVRESFSLSVHMNNWQPGEPEEYVYKADNPPLSLTIDDKWKPSIHMPKAAARIWLEVTQVKVERLQDITEDSARAEGVNPDQTDIHTHEVYVGVTDNPMGLNKMCFMNLWCDLNGTESWTANPWVWVIKFKVLSTTGKPQSLITNP